MKAEFADYLSKIGIKDLFLDRVEIIIQFYEKHILADIESIFVTDYIDEQNIRHFQNLWLFKGKYFMEAKQFLTIDEFDIATFSDRLKHIQILKSDYDFQTSNQKSRLTIRVSNDLMLSGELKASQENCDYLRDIYKKYFINSLL